MKRRQFLAMLGLLPIVQSPWARMLTTSETKKYRSNQLVQEMIKQYDRDTQYPFNNLIEDFTFENFVVGDNSLVDSFTSDNWWNINKRAQEVIENENYYEWLSTNIVRYILFSYENMLRNAKGFPLLGVSEYFTKLEREKLSIEHISAQRAKNVEYDEEFNELFMHSIGNLVIDFVASNSSKGHKNTKEKLHDYNLAPLMSQNEIDEMECNWENADSIKSFIKKRENELKLFIKDQL